MCGDSTGMSSSGRFYRYIVILMPVMAAPSVKFVRLTSPGFIYIST